MHWLEGEGYKIESPVGGRADEVIVIQQKMFHTATVSQ